MIAKWEHLRDESNNSKANLLKSIKELSDSMAVTKFQGKNNDLQLFEKNVLHKMLILEKKNYTPENYSVLKYFTLLEQLEKEKAKSSKNYLKNGRGKNKLR